MSYDEEEIQDGFGIDGDDADMDDEILDPLEKIDEPDSDDPEDKFH